MTLTDLYTTYYSIKKNVSSYRLGQHFINLCIADESDPLLDGLWEMNDGDALMAISIIIHTYKWDCDNLPVVNKALLEEYL